MNIVTCLLTENDCCRTGQKIRPKGVMVHSTGANNPNVKRYVQPSADDPNRAELLKILGTNKNANSWNAPGISKCVHAFVGRFANGSVGVAQTLPTTIRGWHAGTGTSGRSANNTHLSFEICEDALEDRQYFDAVYQTAVELTASWCKEFGLDPLEDGVVIDHSEGYRRGIASGHADVGHWLTRFGKTMDDFRADVAREMEEEPMEEENKTVGTGDNPSAWAVTATEWAKRKGIFNGDGKGNFDWQGPMTREAAAQIVYNIFDALNELERLPDVQ